MLRGRRVVGTSSSRPPRRGRASSSPRGGKGLALDLLRANVSREEFTFLVCRTSLVPVALS